jgi:hypothetical protein
MLTGYEWFRIQFSGLGTCEHNNEPVGSVLDGGFFDQMSGYQFVKKDSDTWNY